MDNYFKFKQVDNIFRWESDFLALEFSHPSIQGYSEFVNLVSENEIMYYYYTVKIFKKVLEWDDDDNDISQWELISEKSTHDFPTITQLKWLLGYQLNDHTITDGQKIHYTNGAVRYSKTMATEGFGCDDFYEITKSVDADEQDERYIVYCGTSIEHQSDLTSVGLRTPYVTRTDMEELLACVTGFIRYSLEENNKTVRLRASGYEVKENKIYEYGITDESIDKNTIESIYAAGDRVEIYTVVDNKEVHYEKVILTKIEGDQVFLNTNQMIQGNTIAYIANRPTEEMLAYKEQAIANDFLGVLSNEGKVEFQQASIEILVKKYKNAIIDRTWMYREEHGFHLNDDKEGERAKAMTQIVKEIIRIIKENLAN